MRRIGIILTSLIAVLLGLGSVAVAQQEEKLLDGKLRLGDGVTVSAGETVDGDLYVFGGDIRVDGQVLGDLFVLGGTVNVTGTVAGDLMVGAGTLDLTGTVQGDLRVGAGQVNLRGPVGEDILAGTGQLRVDGDVGGDLIFGAGLVDVGGTVAGDVLGQTSSYTVTGAVLGTEDVTVDEPEAEKTRPNVFVRGLYRFAALFLIGLLILWLRRAPLRRSIAAIDGNPGPTALWGIGFFFGLVIVPGLVTLVGVLLAIAFGWLGLGLIVGAIVVLIILTWLLTAAIGFFVIAILAPLTVGAWLGTRFLPEGTAGYLAMAAGVAALVVLGLIPVIQVLTWLVVTIMGGGAWIGMMRRSKREQPSSITA